MLRRQEAGEWFLSNPLQFFAIPEFGSCLLPIAIHVLPEKGDFLRSLYDDFTDLSHDLILRTTHLTSTCMRDDTERTIVITPRLDDHIGTRRILLELLDREIFVELGIIADLFSGNQRQNLGQEGYFLNTKGEINEWRPQKEFIIIVTK